MKITDLNAWIIQGNFDWVLVRVDTDEGLRGIGECYASDHSLEIKQFVLSLRRQLIGENPKNIAHLTHKMGLGRISGYKVNAIAGIEIALWTCLERHLMLQSIFYLVEANGIK